MGSEQGDFNLATCVVCPEALAMKQQIGCSMLKHLILRTI
jgi:hypothetical protein